MCAPAQVYETGKKSILFFMSLNIYWISTFIKDEEVTETGESVPAHEASCQQHGMVEGFKFHCENSKELWQRQHKLEIYEDRLYPSLPQHPEEAVGKQWLMGFGQKSRTHIPNAVLQMLKKQASSIIELGVGRHVAPTAPLLWEQSYGGKEGGA